MPYITKAMRDEINEGRTPETPGELTYVLFSQCMEYLERFVATEAKFSDFAEVLGALEATKLELYRRVISAYEEKKMRENGDV